MPEVMTGYERDDRYFATRFGQGRRTVYTLELSPAQIAATLPRPDPSKVTEDNRRINETHARGFGRYLRENPDWIAPAILLRASDIFKFTSKEEVSGVQFGILSVPRLARNDLRILDGQHRILGIHSAIEDIAAEIDKTRSLLAAAKKQDNGELVARYQAQIRELEDQRERLDREKLAVQVYVEDDPRGYRQMFVDIAANALGITSTIRSRFDARKVVNRALDAVLKHALLAGRVDLQQDRVVGSNPNLMGAKHVADIIRTVQVGIAGRIGRRQEAERRESQLAEDANSFLDVLVAAFSPLEDIVEGKLTPEQLRKSSLVGSTTMLRVLAGVYYEASKIMSDDEITDFFSQLASHMGVPITEESIWVTQVGGEIFSPGTSAPKARAQDLRKLTETIVGWARSQPAWLAA